MKPLIGITPMYEYEETKACTKIGYLEGIMEAGGLPIVIPATTNKDILYEIFERLDGLVLSGGSDVDPKFFSEENEVGTGEISPLRDELEIYLAQLAIRFDKPILGICRGSQILNIAAGGNIFQDIYSQSKTKLQHNQKAPKWYPTHEIRLLNGSIHGKLFRTNKIRVNTFHHQAIKELGLGFVATAHSSDGIIEAIEHKNCGFCVGVQYHPELLWQKDRAFLGLFKELVRSVKKD